MEVPSYERKFVTKIQVLQMQWLTPSYCCGSCIGSSENPGMGCYVLHITTPLVDMFWPVALFCTISSGSAAVEVPHLLMWLHEPIKWLCSSDMQHQQPDTVTHTRISSLLISRRLTRARIANCGPPMWPEVGVPIPKFHAGLNGSLQSLDWTGGLVDWTKNHFYAL